MVQAKNRSVYSVSTNNWKPATSTVTQDTMSIALIPLTNGRAEEPSTVLSIYSTALIERN
jgi:hypothetical protein